eukprot:171850-Chlamydomonas_euryale.AAC.3
MAVSYAGKVASSASAANGSSGVANNNGSGSSGGGAAQGMAPPGKRVAPAANPPPARPASLSGSAAVESVLANAPKTPMRQVAANETLLFGAQVLIGYKVEVQVRFMITFLAPIGRERTHGAVAHPSLTRDGQPGRVGQDRVRVRGHFSHDES